MTTERLDAYVQAALTGVLARPNTTLKFEQIVTIALGYALAAMAAVDAHLASISVGGV